MVIVRLIAVVALLGVTGCSTPTPPTSPPTQAASKPAQTTAAAPTATAASLVAASPVATGGSPSPAGKPAAAAPSPSPAAAPGRWTFDNDPVGALPSGAQSFSGQWVVRAEADAPSQPNALCQTGTADFPAIELDMKPYADLTLTTRFKPISGKEDQASGLIFRVQDKDNYYILRANALEDNVNFYNYRGGRRSALRGADTHVASGSWQELRVEVQGNQFRGFLNGQQVTDSSDDSYQSGGIGLWTKADSVTCFDDVEVTER
jgi:3-keto-disaccharide hydrolase